MTHQNLVPAVAQPVALPQVDGFTAPMLAALTNALGVERKTCVEDRALPGEIRADGALRHERTGKQHDVGSGVREGRSAGAVGTAIGHRRRIAADDRQCAVA